MPAHCPLSDKCVKKKSWSPIKNRCKFAGGLINFVAERCEGGYDMYDWSQFPHQRPHCPGLRVHKQAHLLSKTKRFYVLDLFLFGSQPRHCHYYWYFQASEKFPQIEKQLGVDIKIQAGFQFRGNK